MRGSLCVFRTELFTFPVGFLSLPLRRPTESNDTKVYYRLQTNTSEPSAKSKSSSSAKSSSSSSCSSSLPQSSALPRASSSSTIDSSSSSSSISLSSSSSSSSSTSAASQAAEKEKALSSCSCRPPFLISPSPAPPQTYLQFCPIHSTTTLHSEVPSLSSSFSFFKQDSPFSRSFVGHLAWIHSKSPSRWMASSSRLFKRVPTRGNAQGFLFALSPLKFALINWMLFVSFPIRTLRQSKTLTELDSSKCQCFFIATFLQNPY